MRGGDATYGKRQEQLTDITAAVSVNTPCASLIIVADQWAIRQIRPRSSSSPVARPDHVTVGDIESRTRGELAEDVADAHVLSPGESTGDGRANPAYIKALRLAERARRELIEYVEGQRREFTLPLRPEGTAFQRRVWEAVASIPYGQTRTYGDIARMIGNPRAARAVGGANNANPILIVTPCHRVVGARGTLVGYAGGLEMKQWLLDMESGSHCSDR
ncbi:methylated-DNA--[protein]-cysteine S-methyltransferase [Schaalia sp. ZJ1691]|uniref:methylated-DNA--[protein]-cysteine S-methyltransferase n=1 Tax=Schaalia sp. ZJ1691 TaxID=2709404 RepID=UPI0013EDB426|nr:methylated-DNA--[protein]-cysteine S-methyltransferase [Schaalia sp. ZJ1691]